MIQTERLFIRPIQPSDKHAVFAYRSDEITNRFQGWIPGTLEEVQAFIDKNPVEFNTPETWFQLVLIEKTSKELIGDIGVHFKDTEHKQCELGCTLSSEWHSRGFAIEAMQGTITFLFNELGKHRVTASVDPENTPSIRLMEKLGFRKEGHFRKSLFWKGDWVDDVIYALLAENWRAN